MGGVVATKRYVALLRAVNLARHNKVSMADLRRVVATLGFVDPQTLVNSGNLVFGAAARPAPTIERELEAAVKTRLRLDTAFIVRTADEWAALVAHNPFPDEATRDPAHLLVLVLKNAIPAGRLEVLQSVIAGRERVGGGGRHVYAVYPDGIGRSKLTSALIEETLGVRATGRNWNTVLKLKELACV